MLVAPGEVMFFIQLADDLPDHLPFDHLPFGQMKNEKLLAW